MKILLIGNYKPDIQESMQRFSGALKQGLADAGHSVRLIRPEPLLLNIFNPNQMIGKWIGYLDKFVIFPHRLRKALSWPDVVHICDHGNAMYLWLLYHIPHVVTCHDVLAIRSGLGEVLQNRIGLTGRIFQKMILHGLKSARMIVCDSENTRADILRVARIKKERARMIHPGLTYPYRSMNKAESEPYLKAINVSNSKPFFIHVGNNSWYKNRLGVLKIFRRLIRFSEFSDSNMIMVGKPFTPDMRKFINDQFLQKRVKEVRNIDNMTLNALYAAAAALIFPSLEEGFGWPIAEAQACGCPVFTTDRVPMTEAGGNAAIYMKDPEDEASCAKFIHDNLDMAVSRIEAGFKNAKRFSLESMIRSYIEIYGMLVKK